MATPKKTTPKKAAPKKTPAVTPEPEVQEAKEAALKEAADKAAAQIMETPVDHEGHSSLDQLQKVNEVQRDYSPGKFRKGPLEVPKFIYDEDRDVTRRIFRDDVHYAWVHDDKVHQFKAWGYSFCLYNGGSRSGLAEHGFDGTYLYFPPTLQNHVRCADVQLMWAPERLYRALDAERQARVDKQNAAATSKVHNLGYRHGIKTFVQERGEDKPMYN